MRAHPLPRLVVIGLAILAVAGCTVAAPSSPAPHTPPATGPDASSTGGPPTAATASPLPGAPGDAAGAWLLVGRRGEPDLHLVLSTTGELGMDVPSGSPRPAWDRIVTATAAGPATIVRDEVVQPGFGGPELRIDGHWRLPTIGLDPIPAGRSLDGSTIALVEGSYDPSAATSRFAIVEHHLLDARSTAGDTPLRLARVIALPGAFEYDTLSPDGRILYVIQHLDAVAGGSYQVRAVEVATGQLRDGVIVDKGNPDERMAGSPIAQVRRPDGLVLTLYRGPEHPFIHALMSKDGWAVCIDLPAGTAGTDGTAAADVATAALDWGLASSADGQSVFAVNATLGLAVDVDPGGLAVRRSASIGASAAAPIVLAKFGHDETGPVGRRLVAAPDGTLLFAAGADGITAIRTADLAATRHDLAGSAVDSLGITPDGAVLFALVRGGTIVALDARGGRALGTVPGDGYDRLLAVSPG